MLIEFEASDRTELEKWFVAQKLHFDWILRIEFESVDGELHSVFKHGDPTGWHCDRGCALVGHGTQCFRGSDNLSLCVIRPRFFWCGRTGF